MFRGLLIKILTLFAPRTRKLFNVMLEQNIFMTREHPSELVSERLGKLFVMCRYYEATRNILLLLIVVGVITWLCRGLL